MKKLITQFVLAITTMLFFGLHASANMVWTEALATLKFNKANSLVCSVDLGPIAMQVCENTPLSLTFTPTSTNPLPTYTYVLAGPAGFSNAGAIPVSGSPINVVVSAAATPSMAGTYTVTTTDGVGCIATDIVNVTVNLAPVLTTPPPTDLCSADLPFDLTTLEAVIGITGGTWSDPAPTAVTPLDGDPAVQTIYSYTVTSAQGCSTTVDVEVNVTTSPTLVNADTTLQVCNDVPTVDLTALEASLITGIVPGIWTDAASTDITATANAVDPATGPFTFSMGSAPCTVTSIVTYDIIVRPQPIIDLAVDVCSSETAYDLSANDGAMNPAGNTGGVWIDDASGDTIATAIVDITTYAASPITFTYAFGDPAIACEEVGTLTINIIPSADIYRDTTVKVCNNGIMTLDLTALEIPLTYDGATDSSTITWFDVNAVDITATATTAIPTDGPFTLYAVNPADALGLCPVTAIVTVDLIAPPPALVAQVVDICSDITADDLTAYNAAMGALGGIWYEDAALTTLVADPTAADPNLIVYYYVVGDTSIDCINSATLNYNIIPAPTPMLDTVITLCATVTSYDLTVHEAVMNSTAIPGGAWVDAASTPVVDPTNVDPNAGPYTYVVGTAPCVRDAEVSFIIVPLPTVVDVTTTVCSNVLTVDAGQYYIALGGLGGTLLENDMTTLVADTSAIDPTAGPYYYVLGDASISCTDTAELSFIIAPAPVLVDATLQVCIDQAAMTTVDLTSLESGIGGTGGTWLMADMTTAVASPTAADPMLLTYYYVYSDATPCSDTAMATIIPVIKPILIDSVRTICETTLTDDLTALEANLGATGGKWLMSDATTTLATPTAADVTMGPYYYVVGDTLLPCTDTAMVSYNIVALPTPIVVKDTTVSVCSNAKVNLTAYEAWFGTTGGVWFDATPAVLMDPTNADPAMSPYTYVIGDTTLACTDTAVVTFNLVAPPVINDTTVTICSTVTTIDLTLLAPGMTTIDSAKWYYSSGILIPDPTSVTTVDGPYYLWYIDPATSCWDAGWATIVDSSLVDTSIVICASETIFDLTSAEASMLGVGGTWSNASGVISDPTTANPNNGPYTLTVISASGCPLNGVLTFVPAPRPSLLDTIARVCNTLMADDVTQYEAGIGAIGGIWYDVNFAPLASTIVDPHTGPYIYLYPSPGAGCSDTALLSYLFLSGPALTNLTINLCDLSSIENLTSYESAIGGVGGVWSDAAGLVATPTAVIASSGPFTYTYFDAVTGCGSSATLTFVLGSATNLVNDFSALVCDNVNLVNLTSYEPLMGSTGGVWSDASMVVLATTSVDPHSGPFMYTVGSGACSDMATLSFNFNALTALTDYTASVCNTVTIDNLTAYELNMGAVGGTWMDASMVALASTSVDPNAGPYYYSFTNASGCTSTAMLMYNLIVCSSTFTLGVTDPCICMNNANPDGSMGQFESMIFINGGVGPFVVDFTSTAFAYNVSNAINDPADISSLVADVDGITEVSVKFNTGTTYDVIVTDLSDGSQQILNNIGGCAYPTISMGAYGPLCTSNTPITLVATPTGGVYAGTGVSGNTFDPAVAGAGTWTVSYAYTDGEGCLVTSNTTIVVNNCSTGSGELGGVGSVVWYDTNHDGLYTPIAEPFIDANGNGVYDTGESFTDVNGDGVWTAAEAPISAVPVLLYTVGADGIAGTPDDVFVTAVVTDSNGNFNFSGLPVFDALGNPIDYYLQFPGQVVVGSNFASPTLVNIGGVGLSDPNDSDVNGSAATSTFNLSNGGLVGNIGAGYFVEVVVATNFTSFEVNADCKETIITWTVTNESSVENYIILRSNDGTNWEEVTIVNAMNNGVNETYSYADNYVAKTNTFYRISQVMVNGTENVSAIKLTSTTCDDSYSITQIYPNPVNELLNVNIVSTVNVNTRLNIIDLTGRIIYTEEFNVVAGNNIKKINTNNLDQSVYFIGIEGSNKNSYVKFQKID